MTGIHQFVPMLHRYDAVGEHTLALRELLRGSGITSRIYSEVPDPATADETSPYIDYEVDAEPGDVLVYQYATESAMASWLVNRPEPLVVNYHSVTPPEFFAPWNNAIARLQVACLAELALVAPHAALGIAISRFDEAELQAAGCLSTTVIPVLTAGRPLPPGDSEFGQRFRVRSGQTEQPEQPEQIGQPEHPRQTVWLSVGRLAPNKSHQRSIAALFAYRMTVDPSAMLILVGAPSEPNYAAALHDYAVGLGLVDAVHFVNGISDAELAACYELADVLVMLSEHEGFGVPLVEAMRHDLPVVALDAGAVSEVLGDVGVLVADARPLRVAEAVGRLLSDDHAAKQATAGAAEQLRRLGVDSAGSRLIEVLRAVADAPGPVD